MAGTTATKGWNVDKFFELKGPIGASRNCFGWGVG